MKKRIKGEVYSLVKSFSYAVRGWFFCIKNERNMRLHTVVSVAMILFSLVFQLTMLEYAVLIVTMALVLTCEMINTAIEALVNLETGAYDHLARVAKDVAAGAVFVMSIAAVAVGLVLFLKPDKLLTAVVTIATTPAYLIVAILLVVFGLLFIFNGVKIFKKTT